MTIFLVENGTVQDYNIDGTSISWEQAKESATSLAERIQSWKNANGFISIQKEDENYFLMNAGHTGEKWNNQLVNGAHYYITAAQQFEKQLINYAGLQEYHTLLCQWLNENFGWRLIPNKPRTIDIKIENLIKQAYCTVSDARNYEDLAALNGVVLTLAEKDNKYIEWYDSDLNDHSGHTDYPCTITLNKNLDGWEVIWSFIDVEHEDALDGQEPELRFQPYKDSELQFNDPAFEDGAPSKDGMYWYHIAAVAQDLYNSFSLKQG